MYTNTPGAGVIHLKGPQAPSLHPKFFSYPAYPKVWPKGYAAPKVRNHFKLGININQPGSLAIPIQACGPHVHRRTILGSNLRRVNGSGQDEAIFTARIWSSLW